MGMGLYICSHSKLLAVHKDLVTPWQKMRAMSGHESPLAIAAGNRRWHIRS
jgi:hypothetical protein